MSENEHLINFEEDSDLLESIQKFVSEQNISQGLFSIIGAVKNVKFAFYDQEQERYLEMFLNEKAEILHCTGTIQNGKVHAHITLGDREGQAFGGHLIAAKIYKAEAWVRKL